jgi:hypothetical protein
MAAGTLEERLARAKEQYEHTDAEFVEIWDDLDTEQRIGAADYLKQLAADVKFLRERLDAKAAEDLAISKHATVTKAAARPRKQAH